ncbi:S-layer family protein [Caldicellulosiruptor bescii]|uniref:S-layer domain protein n=2 Tax=Caldicellulosiruptor bescii TaxID=31899 RepID=B9MKS4_CALBD|nr:S-layer homology domain-containing protein [Caldicellulosiruptor bescii]ACM60932.1 S-layer domain protein [Caldicellulosiruptor bescii DSM 6725]PBC89249.1 S-layer family protein [Caldicellulosiruptor bescii]PBC91266.1 S-layer family protein [Caldicellulosiruptor bescii]PBD03320.1 S-layer family protein [Caldicellulosiruptor bescii]PBD07065.1 S-layer family protein [Caldicellulosiruptor bescii]
MKLFKKRLLLICVMLVFAIVQIFSAIAFAQGTSNPIFSDLPQNHWAYNAVKFMVERGIITGYPDNTFRPDNPVTRAEFARIMVISLNLPIKVTDNPSFKDVPKDHWAYPHVETAKFYLTGFRTQNGDYFKPSDYAVREDMAVALVKAKGLQNENVDLSILSNYIDKDQISKNLVKHVAIAIAKGIMVGSPVSNSNQYKFDPQGILTRAQAAVLLYNVINAQSTEEKVTYDDSSSGSNQQYTYPVPNVTAYTKGDRVVLIWNRINDKKLKGYAVVISKNNSQPGYPQDGYLTILSDRNANYIEIGVNSKYNNGDFGAYIKSGEEYYFSVTAIYEGNVYVKGNAVKMRMPVIPNYFEKPSVKYEYKDNKFVLSWQKIDDFRLIGYWIVISKKTKEPKYPDNGYLVFINDKNTTQIIIDNTIPYKNGDFGEYLKDGEEYYFSVTAQYQDRVVPGNSIKAIYYSNLEIAKLRPKLQAKTVRWRGQWYINLRWDKIDSDKLQGYKVVVSDKNSTPDLNKDGLLAVISDKNVTSVNIKAKDKYLLNGEYKELKRGHYYYFTVYAIYSDRVVDGNVIRIKIP